MHNDESASVSVSHNENDNDNDNVNVKDKDSIKSYHHGELREALLDAAWNMINEQGVDSFTIVKAAEKAGVSKAAPYRHFKDRDSLLHAVIATGFDRLGKQALNATASFDKGSRDKIIAGGHNYLNFFRQYSAFFDLMFRSDFPVPDFSLENKNRRLQCMQLHIEAVHEWCIATDVPESKAIDTAIKLWATVHGMVSLSLNDNFEQVELETSIEEMLSTFTHSFLDGVEANYKIN